jgi:T-complex protein 1 subunit theta
LRAGKLAASTPGLEQYAIKKYAESFEVFARTLTENSGQNAQDVIAALYAAHAAGNHTVGVDIEGGGGGVCDAAAAGILDVFAAKQSALRLAVDAALTVLRVDQIIMSKPAGGPKLREPGPADPDD